MIDMDDFSEKLNSLLGSEEGMKKIQEIAGALGGGALGNLLGGEKQTGEQNEKNNNSADVSLSMLDTETISKISAALGSINKNDDQRVLLLNALKPYIGKKRAPHVDTAIKLLALSKFKDLFL